MRLQLDKLWKYAQSVAASKLDDTDQGGYNKINKEKAAKTIIKTDAALPDKLVILRYTEVHNVVQIKSCKNLLSEKDYKKPPHLFMRRLLFL